MMHKLKVFALASVAVLAIGAAAASTAQAVPKFTAAAYPAKLEGQSGKTPTIFNLGGTQAKCNKTTLEGVLEAASSSLVIGRSYSECTMKIGGVTRTVTFTAHECTFLLHDIKEIDEITYKSNVDIICPAGKQIEIHVYETEIKHLKGEAMCTFAIPAQAELTPVELKDIKEAPTDVEVRPGVENLFYERIVGNEANCGPQNGEKGSYTGVTTMIGRDATEKQINIDVG